MSRAIEIVKTYLSAMEARELEHAQSLLGEGFEMTFPGTGPMKSLQELIDWSRPRYAFVKKAFDGIDEVSSASGPDVIYCRGTLFGAWPDGKAFDGIRFIDRFEVMDGKIIKQEVWNDIAEVRGQS